MSDDFGTTIAQAYASEGAALDIGRGVHDGELVHEAAVRVPLSMVNRHGLIAGATGTGKTKTLQGLAEQLSAAGVPVFVADMKGDLSGLAAPGEAGSAAEKRNADLGVPFTPTGFPVEYLALGGIGPGVPVRAAGEAATEAQAPKTPPTPKPKAEHKEVAGAAAGGAAAIGSFLKSRQGKQLQRQVMRGVFGMLRKKM